MATNSTRQAIATAVSILSRWTADSRCPTLAEGMVFIVLVTALASTGPASAKGTVQAVSPSHWGESHSRVMSPLAAHVAAVPSGAPLVADASVSLTRNTEALRAFSAVVLAQVERRALQAPGATFQNIASAMRATTCFVTALVQRPVDFLRLTSTMGVRG